MLLNDPGHYIVPAEVDIFPISALSDLETILRSVLLRHPLLSSLIRFLDGEYHLVEMIPRRLRINECVDLSSHEPDTQSLLLNRVRLQFHSMMVASGKTDQALCSIIPVRLSATRYLLLAAFDHAIADLASSRIFSASVRSVLWRYQAGVSTSRAHLENKKTEYRDYLSSMQAVDHERADAWLRHSSELEEYRDAVRLIRARFENGSPRYGRPVLLEYEPKLDSRHQTRRLALYLFIRLSFRVLSCSALPVHVIREGRLLNGIDYRKTIGDFHTIVPVAFNDREALTPDVAYQRVVDTEKLLLNHDLNVWYLSRRPGVDQLIAETYQEYVNFNYVGKLTSVQEAGYLSLPPVNYRCLGYLYNGKLRFVVYSGIKDDTKLIDLGLSRVI